MTRALSTFGVVLLLSVAPPIEVSAEPAVEASAGVVVPVGKLAGFRDRGAIAAIAAEQQIRGTSSVRGVWPTST